MVPHIKNILKQLKLKRKLKTLQAVKQLAIEI
jgi:hypothetical protein